MHTIIDKYKTEYANYNTQLNTLVNGEIAMLEKSIKAKEADIKLNKEQVTHWENLKSTATEALEELGNALDTQGDKFESFADKVSDALAKLNINTAVDKIKDVLKNGVANIGLTGLLSGVTHYATGGVNTSTGMAWLDGTASRPELVLNNADAAKLFGFIHAMPNVNAGGNNNLNSTVSKSKSFDGATFIFNGVQNPQQFSQAMENWLKNETTRSKVM